MRLNRFLPGALLSWQKLHASFNLPGRAAVDHPNNFAAGFLFAELYPDYIPSLQRMIDSCEGRAFTADIGGIGILKKRPPVRIHAPHTHQDDGRKPGFRSSIHVFPVPRAVFSGVGLS